jgi:hypothetical protein
MRKNESNSGYWVAFTYNSLVRFGGISGGLIIIVTTIINLIGRQSGKKKN